MTCERGLPLNGWSHSMKLMLSSTSCFIIFVKIERENKLSQRRLELNSKEIELNSKLSEAEVIFLNMKPLIKGLNKIMVSDEMGGSKDE